MRTYIKTFYIFWVLLFVQLGATAAQVWGETDSAVEQQRSSQPNIVIIMADDLGYGDVQPLNRESKIETPAFSQLAKQGVTFTDAHSPSAVCTPTRYGLLCGRYAWRTRLKRGVLGGYSKPLLEKEEQTIATVLKSAGYQTGCIGKWHLGLGWEWSKEPKNINYFGIAGKPGFVDYSQPLRDTPIHHGFDYSFIIPASLDMSPYVYIENDRVTAEPSRILDASKFPKFYRKGELADDFKIVEVLDRVTETACRKVLEFSKSEKPYFLYVPLPAPHKPVIPNKIYSGISGMGPYGDFVMQVDAAVGKIHAAVQESGEAKNTLFVVTSDNGSFMRRFEDSGKEDHVRNETIQGFTPNHHMPNGILRGTKADIWEAGHRVPFFASWPGKIKPGRVNQTICHTDLLATCAEVAAVDFDATHGQDSYSFWPLLNDPAAEYKRAPVIHHSVSGMFAMRQGDWKLVLGNGSGGREQPKGKPFAKPYQLFNMATDLAEEQDLAIKSPDRVETLESIFYLTTGLKPVKN